MEKDEFKYRLFNVLNESGEEELELKDIIIRDKEDIIEIIGNDESRFEILIRKP